MKEAYTVKEAAEVLGCHTVTIRRAIDAGELKSAKIGKIIRISKEDLNAYYQSKGGGGLFKSDEATGEDKTYSVKRSKVASIAKAFLTRDAVKSLRQDLKDNDWNAVGAGKVFSTSANRRITITQDPITLEDFKIIVEDL